MLKKATTKKIKKSKKIKKVKKKAVSAKSPVIKVKKIKKETPKEKTKESSSYLEAIGRRKTAVARIRLWTKKGKEEFLVNSKPYQNYFISKELQQITIASLKKMKSLDRFQISARVRGGGIHSQAEAVRHGISRALVLFNQEYRKKLKKAGFLTRDPRMKERKKPGLKRARRAPQWRKR